MILVSNDGKWNGDYCVLRDLFESLIDVFDGARDIERHSRDALREAAFEAELVTLEWNAEPLRAPFLDAMNSPTAHSICKKIAALPFHWAPPTTSDDPKYVEHSLPKAHVEILGPNGLVKSDQVRLGLYGMMPHSEYGIRTHPAEEIYIMLAGSAFWMVGNAPYVEHSTGARSFHPSMIDHSTKTGAQAFMSVYVWHGDLSTEKYSYEGLPEGR